MKKIENERDTRKAWIRYRLISEGWSMTKLAEALGVRPKTAQQIFHRRYPRAQKKVAEILDASVESLFPEFYPLGGGAADAT